MRVRPGPTKSNQHPRDGRISDISTAYRQHLFCFRIGRRVLLAVRRVLQIPFLHYPHQEPQIRVLKNFSSTKKVFLSGKQSGKPVRRVGGLGKASGHEASPEFKLVVVDSQHVHRDYLLAMRRVQLAIKQGPFPSHLVLLPHRRRQRRRHSAMAAAIPYPPPSTSENDIFSISDAQLAQRYQFLREVSVAPFCASICACLVHF